MCVAITRPPAADRGPAHRHSRTCQICENGFTALTGGHNRVRLPITVVIGILEMVLGELADIQMGYAFRSRLEADPAGQVAVIQMKDIDDANMLHAERAVRVSLPSVRPHHLLQPGDIVFRSRGRSNGAALVREGIGVAILAAPMLLVRSRGLLPDYLCWFLNQPATQATLERLAAGTSVLMISAEALRALDVPAPSAAIQRRIADAAVLADREQSLMQRIADLRKRVTDQLLMKSACEAKS